MIDIAEKEWQLDEQCTFGRLTSSCHHSETKVSLIQQELATRTICSPVVGTTIREKIDKTDDQKRAPKSPCVDRGRGGYNMSMPSCCSRRRVTTSHGC